MPGARARRQRRVVDRLAARGGRAWPRTSACASSSWWSGWGTRRQHVPLARSLRRLPYGAAGSARARTSAHGLAPAGSPRPRRNASSRTLESAGDKDACATCQCPKGRCTLRVLAVPLLKRTTLLTSPQARGKKALPSCTTCREPRRGNAGNRSGVTPPIYDGALIPDRGGKRCA